MIDRKKGKEEQKVKKRQYRMHSAEENIFSLIGKKPKLTKYSHIQRMMFINVKSWSAREMDSKAIFWYIYIFLLCILSDNNDSLRHNRPHNISMSIAQSLYFMHVII